MCNLEGGGNEVAWINRYSVVKHWAEWAAEMLTNKEEEMLLARKTTAVYKLDGSGASSVHDES